MKIMSVKEDEIKRNLKKLLESIKNKVIKEEHHTYVKELIDKILNENLLSKFDGKELNDHIQKVLDASNNKNSVYDSLFRFSSYLILIAEFSFEKKAEKDLAVVGDKKSDSVTKEIVKIEVPKEKLVKINTSTPVLDKIVNMTKEVKKEIITRTMTHSSVITGETEKNEVEQSTEIDKENVEEEEFDEEGLTQEDRKNLYRIEKLDKHLLKLHEKINQLEKVELNFKSKMGKLNYEVAERMSEFTKNYVKYHKKLTKICKENPHLVELEDLKQIKCTTQFNRSLKLKNVKQPVIVQKINKNMIRAFKKDPNDYVPDFKTMLEWVTESNVESNLNLSKLEIDDIAKNAAEEVVKILQYRRVRYDQKIIEDRLESISEKPDIVELHQDEELRQKFIENDKIRDKKLNQLIEEFQKKYEENNKKETADNQMDILNDNEVEEESDEEKLNDDENSVSTDQISNNLDEDFKNPKSDDSFNDEDSADEEFYQKISIEAKKITNKRISGGNNLNVEKDDGTPKKKIRLEKLQPHEELKSESKNFAEKSKSNLVANPDRTGKPMKKNQENNQTANENPNAKQTPANEIENDCIILD